MASRSTQKDYKLQVNLSRDEKNKLDEIMKNEGFSSIGAATKYMFAQIIKGDSINGVVTNFVQLPARKATKAQRKATSDGIRDNKYLALKSLKGIEDYFNSL